MRPRILVLLLLGALASMPVFAECGTLFWVKQGDQERFFSFGEEVVLKAGGSAVFRILYKRRGESPETTATEIGHPWDFGLEGYAPHDQAGVLTMRQQQQQHFNRGRVDLEVGNPGTASIGYQIYGVGGGQKIPDRCATGVAWIKVVSRDNG